MGTLKSIAIQTVAGVAAVLLAQWLINNVRAVRRTVGSL